MEYDGKPVVMANTDNIDDYEEIARDFLNRMFDIDYDDCFISDESAISDFTGCGDDSDEIKSADEWDAMITEKIHNQYGVEVKDVNTYLVDVFESIRQARLQTRQ